MKHIAFLILSIFAIIPASFAQPRYSASILKHPTDPSSTVWGRLSDDNAFTTFSFSRRVIEVVSDGAVLRTIAWPQSAIDCRPVDIAFKKAINDFVTLVNCSSSFNSADRRAYLATGNQLAALPELSAQTTEGRALNSSGLAVGLAYALAGSSSYPTSVIWGEGSTLPIPNSGMIDGVTNISSNGFVVGNLQPGSWLYNLGLGQNSILAAAGSLSNVQAVNSSAVAVGYAIQPPSGQSQAMIWPKPGAVTNVGAQLQAQSSFLMDINDSGVAIGRYESLSEPGLWKGFIYFKGKPFDLGSLIQNRIASFPPRSALSINSKGSIVIEDQEWQKYLLVVAP